MRSTDVHRCRILITSWSRELESKGPNRDFLVTPKKSDFWSLWGPQKWSFWTPKSDHFGVSKSDHFGSPKVININSPKWLILVQSWDRSPLSLMRLPFTRCQGSHTHITRCSWCEYVYIMSQRKVITLGKGVYNYEPCSCTNTGTVCILTTS